MPPIRSPIITSVVLMSSTRGFRPPPVSLARARAEGAEQRQGGQRRRADGEALADGRGRVAHRVQRVGALAHLGGQFGHLGQAAGVVRHRAVGVDAEGNSERREHADRGDRHAVDITAIRWAHVDGDADQEATGRATDSMPVARPWMMFVAAPVSDCSAMFCAGLVSVLGVVLGDLADDDADEECRR